VTCGEIAKLKLSLPNTPRRPLSPRGSAGARGARRALTAGDLVAALAAARALVVFIDVGEKQTVST
jgi:hypothetical protein